MFSYAPFHFNGDPQWQAGNEHIIECRRFHHRCPKTAVGWGRLYLAAPRCIRRTPERYSGSTSLLIHQVFYKMGYMSSAYYSVEPGQHAQADPGGADIRRPDVPRHHVEH